MTKPSIKFKSRYVYGENIIESDCDKSEALMTLLKRKTLSPTELHLVGRMGFDINITGDKKQFKEELKVIGSEEVLTYY